MNQESSSIFNLSFSELQNYMTAQGHSGKFSSRLYGAIFRKTFIPEDYTFLSLALRSDLQKNFVWSLPQIIHTQKSHDGTIKFLLQLSDGKKIECVLLNFFKKYTLCISSQVGCAMKCSFCYTGTQGLSRHLLSEEIIGEILTIRKWLKENGDKKDITNLVFMGQGEPLHNFQQLHKALEIITHPFGIGISPKNITLSTSGYLPGLELALLEPLFHRINWALSLHSTQNERRNILIPINKSYPIQKVLEVLKKFTRTSKQVFQIEYLLLEDFNDDIIEAHELSRILQDIPHMVNIIPYNPLPVFQWKRPSQEKTENFRLLLAKNKIRAMTRTTRGDDIMAACGQLVS
jgi:23S rRNA (adenine2503-C2)-methyltransferase